MNYSVLISCLCDADLNMTIDRAFMRESFTVEELASYVSSEEGNGIV
jgi:hypothetical protein